MAKVTKIKQLKNFSWTEALEQFLFWKRAQGISQQTQKDYEGQVRLFFRRYEVYLRTFFNWCVEEEMLELNPIKSLKNVRMKAEQLKMITAFYDKIREENRLLKFDLKLSDLINLPTTFLTAILISSGIILFSPEELLRQLYMLDFRKNQGFIIGLVFICCLSLLVVNLIYQASQSVKKNRNRRNFYASAESRLRKLNNYQKALVYLLFIQDNRTHPLPLHDGAVLELESNMVIGKATNQYFVSD